MKYFSWWLGTGSLTISYDPESKTIWGLMLGMWNETFRDNFTKMLRSKAHLASQPMLLPLIICEILAKKHNKVVDTSTKRITKLETAIGVNDYTEGKHSIGNAEVNYFGINQTLNGELSRLANYEKWVSSHILLIRGILQDPTLSLNIAKEENDPETQMLRITVKEWGEHLLGWNTDLVARIACQQKIVQGQLQTVSSLGPS